MSSADRGAGNARLERSPQGDFAPFCLPLSRGVARLDVRFWPIADIDAVRRHMTESVLRPEADIEGRPEVSPKHPCKTRLVRSASKPNSSEQRFHGSNLLQEDRSPWLLGRLPAPVRSVNLRLSTRGLALRGRRGHMGRCGRTALANEKLRGLHECILLRPSPRPAPR